VENIVSTLMPADCRWDLIRCLKC